MAEITMPRLSDSMEEGTIIRWLKADGDEVRRDEELLEIETDKATVAYEADASGVLSIAVREGETVPVGAKIGELAAAGSGEAEAGSGEGDAGSGEGEADGEAEAGSGDTGSGEAGSGVRSEGDASGTVGGDGGSAGSRGSSPDNGRLERAKASPLARRIASRLHVDLAEVSGSGPAGRVLKRDVIAHAEGGAAGAGTAGAGAAAATSAAVATAAGAATPASATPASAHPPQAAPRVAPAAAGSPQEAGTARGRATSEELTRTQAVIARRMAESRATVPAFSLEVDIDMTAMLAARTRLKQIADPAPSLNDIVVKACAVALRRHPRANGSYRDGAFQLHGRVNIGIAVAAHDALIVPTITDADEHSLPQIAQESRRLIAAARERTLTPAELAGATFTVSNLGMYGIDRFEGIINPPQAAILSVGAIVQRPVVRNGEVVARSMMSATLACDHRILYGAEAAELLADIKGALEEPLALAL